MARRSRSLVPLSLFLAGMLIAFQTTPVPTQTTPPSPTLYGVQGGEPDSAAVRRSSSLGLRLQPESRLATAFRLKAEATRLG